MSIGGVTRLEPFDSKSQYATKKPYDTNTQLNYEDDKKGPFEKPMGKGKIAPKDQLVEDLKNDGVKVLPMPETPNDSQKLLQPEE